ncbi:MAG: hypothetical protein U9N81_02595 [Bacillota bacterium]|nr:hypothetical protein [Bacillota bacterium]
MRVPSDDENILMVSETAEKELADPTGQNLTDLPEKEMEESQEFALMEIEANSKMFEELVESEKNLQFITAHMLDVICILSSEWEIKYVSSSVQNVFGYISEELINVCAFDIVYAGGLCTVSDCL